MLNKNSSKTENMPENGDKTVVVERQKQSKLQVASFVWTIISTIYTIGTVFTFVYENWVPSEFNIPLIVLLVVWIIAFVVIIGLALSSRDAKKGQKAIKIYKKSIKIFKAFVNVLFVVITAVSFAGVAHEGIEGFRQWIVMIFTLAVAVVQLALKISIIIIKLLFKRKGKGKKVTVATFTNGVEKHNKFEQKVLAKFYESDDDK